MNIVFHILQSLLGLGLFFPAAVATPIVSRSSASPSGQNESHAILNMSGNGSFAFLWVSTGIAVVTALVQGMVTALSYMTESSGSWTFRFRLAKIEHWWWTLVSAMLVVSMVLSILSFLAGNNQDAVAVLVLSSTTFLAIVRYMIPAWRSKSFLRNRYLAWTGPSRTVIENTRRTFCGSAADWRYLALAYSSGPQDRIPVASDGYGWHIWSVGGIKYDPTDILQFINHMNIEKEVQNRDFVFDDGNPDPKTLSLYWGLHSGFRPRVSRSVSSVPVNLLKSQPLTTDGFSGEGLCLAMGILGRNKGLKPENLVFELTPDLLRAMEANSTWYPRPSKTLRSYYTKVMTDIYGGIGPGFVGAAVELALVLMDATPDAIKAWLTERAEQQVFRVNKELVAADADKTELQAHYQSSYVSMFISLNNMADSRTGRRDITSKPLRPDIICLGLLLRARGHPKPAWWDSQKFAAMREDEKRAINFRWEDNAARLLGLRSFPVRAASADIFDYWAVDNVPSSAETIAPTPNASRSSGSRSI